MKILLSLATFVAALITALAVSPSQSIQGAQETPAPQKSRSVKNRELLSTKLPEVKLKFGKTFKYVGSQSFVLYDVANAEQHFFVDTDKNGRIKRLYWVQFEGYLPNNTHTYRYKSSNTVEIAGLMFFADANALNIKATTSRPGSDGSRAQAFLKSKGYELAGDEILMQRLVHLTDETKRNELMIIYMEEMSGMGATAADLNKGGAAAARWDEISKGLLDRALKGMKVSRYR
jgi:hypothetical protein